MIAEGKGVQAGVHFLAGAVNAAAFVEELRLAGLDTRVDWQVNET
jgi:hypothetical protein